MSFLSHCFRKLTNTDKLRGYKVTDANRTRKVGIACRNLHELKQKACNKFGITNDLSEISIFLLDGSEIDEEYFCTLEPQTTVIVQKPGEKILSDADLLYNLLRKVNHEYITAGEKVSEFLTEKLKRKVAILNNTLRRDDSKTALSSRKDHPEWFEGLETSISTKEAYMHRRCQDRIRGYLYKTTEQIQGSSVFNQDKCTRKKLLRIITFLRLQLKEDHYFGHYFDRSRVRPVETKSEVEEVDSSIIMECYEHCPCHVKLYFPIKPHQIFIDEVDTRKFAMNASSSSKSAALLNEEDQWFYSISPKNTRQQIVLCDRHGEFKCGGIWKFSKCRYGDSHKINPYRSREELILFSTWNLDHRMERSRVLIPQLIETCQQKEPTQKDVIDFYDNLFTVKNLKLVHIICHDKGSHK